VSRQKSDWSLVDSKNDAREPKLIGSRRYNSASSTGTGIAGQASLVINGAIADLVAMTERVMGNVA